MSPSYVTEGPPAAREPLDKGTGRKRHARCLPVSGRGAVRTGPDAGRSVGGHAGDTPPGSPAPGPGTATTTRPAAALCLAATADREPPEWVLQALPGLPEEMAEGTRRAGTVERECVDLVGAALPRDRVGSVFDGYVIDVEDDRPAVGTVHIEDPAIVARIDSDAPLPLGEHLRVRLTQAGPGSAKVRFAPV